MKTRKKWLRKTTAICTAALLGTAAIPSTAFAADSYASIEKDAWAKKVTEMASSYATSIEESQSLMSGMQSDMILKFEDSGRSLLGFVAPFDVSWLDNVTLSNDISFTEGKEGILMKVLLNDNKICTLEYYLDPDSQDIYMRIPELSDKYFKTNLEEAADQQAANIENDMRYYFKPIREFPAGRGFADFVYLPKPEYSRDYPALVVELKWNQNAQTAIRQIKNRQYPEAVANYTDNILLVGISYDKKQKTHNCVIEKYSEK